MKIITLTNGKRVANFSSPHPFEFEDGSILPAVSNKEAERLKVTFIEDIDDNGDVTLDFTLSKEVWKRMTEWMEIHAQGGVDVVFCPMPMMVALRNIEFVNVKAMPFRAVRIPDRITKKVSINYQCL